MFLKQSFQREQDSVFSGSPDQMEVSELTKAGEGQIDREICMKSKDSTTIEITRTKDQNLAGKAETEEDQEIHTKMKSSEHSDCKDETVDLQKCQLQLYSLKKENRDLQIRFKDFVCQSKQFRMENEKLIHELGMCKEQVATLSSKLKTESDKFKLEAQVGQKSLTWIRLIDMLHCAMVAILAIRSDCL